MAKKKKKNSLLHRENVTFYVTTFTGLKWTHFLGIENLGKKNFDALKFKPSFFLEHKGGTVSKTND